MHTNEKDLKINKIKVWHIALKLYSTYTSKNSSCSILCQTTFSVPGPAVLPPLCRKNPLKLAVLFAPATVQHLFRVIQCMQERGVHDAYCKKGAAVLQWMSTLQLEPQKQKILFDKSYLVYLLELRFPPSKAAPFNQLFFLFFEFSNPPIIHIPPGFPPPHAISPQSKEAGNRNNIWISTYGRWREGGRGQIGNHHHQRKIHEVEEKASICPVFTKCHFRKKIIR